jgi:hypothetical protein
MQIKQVLKGLLVLSIFSPWAHQRTHAQVRSHGEAESIIVAGGKIPLEPTQPSKLVSLRVGLYVDASASMNGFKLQLPAIYRVLSSSLTAASGVYFNIENAETAYFSSRRKFFSVTNTFNPAPVPKAAEYTNLDDAIDRAGGRELSIVVTDGVPASSKRDSGCSNGVDLGCVADKLSQAMATGPVPKSEPAGLWIIPIITGYNGLFFTEQLRPIRDFNASVVESNVSRDTGQRGARAGQPSNDRNGDLMFQYSGPRMMMVIVMTHYASAGRGYVREIYNSAIAAAISVKQSPTAFVGGTSLLPPVEVYPGWAHPTGWVDCHKTREFSGAFGPCSIAQPTRLVIRCGARAAQAVYHLTPRPSLTQSPITLYMLPSMEVSAPQLPRGNLQEVKWGELGGSADILVNCSQKRPLSCGDPRARTTWIGSSHFGNDALVRGVSAQYLASLSTDDPTTEPHRLFGLKSLVENLYKRQLQSISVELAALEVCQQ